jgi:hypothetical protein
MIAIVQIPAWNKMRLPQDLLIPKNTGILLTEFT